MLDIYNSTHNQERLDKQLFIAKAFIKMRFLMESGIKTRVKLTKQQAQRILSDSRKILIILSEVNCELHLSPLEGQCIL